TVLAFLPMLLMQNGSGTFMRAMPVTVVLTLFASLLVALTLTPLLASRLGRSDKIPLAQRLLMRVAGGSYERHLNRALQRPGRVLSISVLLLIGSLDRKSTRLNSSHVKISYAVFCLKKKKR